MPAVENTTKSSISDVRKPDLFQSRDKCLSFTHTPIPSESANRSDVLQTPSALERPLPLKVQSPIRLSSELEVPFALKTQEGLSTSKMPAPLLNGPPVQSTCTVEAVTAPTPMLSSGAPHLSNHLSACWTPLLSFGGLQGVLTYEAVNDYGSASPSTSLALHTPFERREVNHRPSLALHGPRQDAALVSHERWHVVSPDHQCSTPHTRPVLQECLSNAHSSLQLHPLLPHTSLTQGLALPEDDLPPGQSLQHTNLYEGASLSHRTAVLGLSPPSTGLAQGVALMNEPPCISNEHSINPDDLFGKKLDGLSGTAAVTVDSPLLAPASAEPGTSSSARGTSGGKVARVVLHIDVDSFFCQVEVLDNPTLRGRPVVVQQFNQGGFVSVSYEAKAAGTSFALCSRPL